MKRKPKALRSALMIAAAVAVWIITANFLGIGTMRSAIRIGYTGTDGWRSWSASYLTLDGKLKHTIRPKDTHEALHVEIVTESGSISLEMKDKNGTVIFEQDAIATSTFDVKISGKVVVLIEADHHRGSFDIAAVE